MRKHNTQTTDISSTINTDAYLPVKPLLERSHSDSGLERESQHGEVPSLVGSGAS